MAERRENKREATQRRAAARRAAEAAERARAARRRRNLIGGVVAAVVVVVALVVVFAVQSSRTSTSATAAVPAHTIANGTVIEVTAADVAGTAGAASSSPGGSAPVVVNLYEDLQCPNCKAFEEESGSTLAALLAQGKVVLHYHPMAFLDSSANGNFSTRALNAAAVVLDNAGPGAFQKFHDLIYAHQTPEEGPGMSNAQLVTYANQAGATGPAVTSAIDGGKYDEWTKKVTDQASKDGVTGTPTVIIGGKKVADLSPSGITAAVTAAAAG